MRPSWYLNKAVQLNSSNSNLTNGSHYHDSTVPRQQIFYAIYYIEFFAGIYLTCVATYVIGKDTKRSGWRYISAANIHLLNKVCADLFQLTTIMFEDIMQDTGAFLPATIQTGSSSQSISVKMFVLVDFFQTFTWMYMILSVAYLCIQRCRMVTNPDVQFDRYGARYELLFMWSLAFVLATVNEWIFTNFVAVFTSLQLPYDIGMALVFYVTPVTAIWYHYFRMQNKRRTNSSSGGGIVRDGFDDRQLLAQRTIMLARIYTMCYLPYFCVWIFVAIFDPHRTGRIVSIACLIFVGDLFMYLSMSLYPFALIYIDDYMWHKFLQKYAASPDYKFRKKFNIN